jgi:tRNA (mo5U34)-methyltransferase
VAEAAVQDGLQQPSHIRAEVDRLTWYHTIELPGGIVTPGEYDTREALRRVPFPADLTGKRCLDVGTHDGFWAFEMERRGADEVIAIDLDDPRETDISEPVPTWTEELVADRIRRPLAFACAHRVLNSKVDRRDLSVYKLSTEAVGEFDFAFIGTLLLHLRDPPLALTAIRKVLRPGGRLLVNDAISLELTLRHPRAPVHQLTLLPGRPFWWSPNLAGLRRFVEKAGFGIVDSGRPYLLPKGAGYSRPRVPVKLTNVISATLHNRGFMAHGWVLGEAP